MNGIRWLVPLLVVTFGFSLSAQAGTITYTCNANSTTLETGATSSVMVSGISTSTCNTLNTTVAGLYASTFSNANASVYITYGNTALGSNETEIAPVDYSTYQTALASHASGDATDTSFLANDATTTTPAIGTGSNLYVSLTTALANALGFTDTYGINANGASCTLGATGCYNSILTIADGYTLSTTGYYKSSGVVVSTGTSAVSGEYNFYSVAEHETDEILGTSSCLGSGSSNGSAVAVDACNQAFQAPASDTVISAADLGRFSSNGTRTFGQSGTAYFSVNGGLTGVANYNNSPNGDDFGDWSNVCSGVMVQDAEGCPGTAPSITTDGGAEIEVLDAVGYNLNTAPTVTPEPPAGLLLLTGLLLGGLLYWRKQRVLA
ncbi:MAG: hypothetical protein ACRD04_04125 [Terriglobales bacterium]